MPGGRSPNVNAALDEMRAQIADMKVKYATDITEQKMRLADYEGQIAAIDIACFRQSLTEGCQ